MSLTVRFSHPAPTGQRFDPGCFDHTIGKKIPVHRTNAPRGNGDAGQHMATIIAARVAPDGSEVEFEVQLWE